MIRAILHNEESGFREDVPPSDISDLIPDSGNLLWIDIQDPTEANLATLKEEFGFHELALEDVARPHQRPKIEEYEGYYFLVVYAAETGEDSSLRLHEVDLFVGRNYLVSLHHGPVKDLAEAADRWRRHRERLDQGIGPLVYSVLDTIVDSYFPILDRVAERVEDLEDRIFKRLDPSALEGIFAVKKDLLALRRVLGPERDVVNHFLRRDLPVFSPAMLPYFQDVYDHLLRILDSVDLYRDLLTSALDAHLSVTSNTLNQIMKRLTAMTVVLMVPTLIAGIYGMNFRTMPELDWPPGYFVVLAAMATVSAVLALLFRRRGWL